MATYIQGTATASSPVGLSVSTSLAYGSSVGQGSMLLATGWWQSGDTLPTVLIGDNVGGVWTQVAFNWTGDPVVSIENLTTWVCYNAIGGGTTVSFSVTAASGENITGIGLLVAEINFDSVSTDGSAINTTQGASISSIYTGDFSTTFNGDFVYAVAIGAANTPTGSAGFSIGTSVLAGGFVWFADEWQLQSAFGTVNPGFTFTAEEANVTINGIAFKFTARPVAAIRELNLTGVGT